MTNNAFRDEYGRFLPGNVANPSGRPKMRATITGEVISLLNQNPIEIKAIAQAWLNACKQPDIRALTELLDRLEGRVASEVNLKALIVNVGDDYAREGIEAIKRDMLERKERYLLKEGEDATE